MNWEPLLQAFRRGCSRSVGRPASTPERSHGTGSAWCIGSARKMFVVNTDERLSECDEAPCPLYCKLTPGEGSPGSPAQGPAGDKASPIHHGPTPAPELPVAPGPHPPPKGRIHQVPSGVYLQCQGGSRSGQSLHAETDLEFPSARAGRGREVWDVFVSVFPAVTRRALPRWHLWSKGTSRVPGGRVNSCPGQHEKTFISEAFPSCCGFHLCFRWHPTPCRPDPRPCSSAAPGGFLLSGDPVKTRLR